MMPTTMVFSIANKHGIGIAMMTAAPKKANISKNNRKSIEKQQLCRQKQQLGLRQQQNNNQ